MTNIYKTVPTYDSAESLIDELVQNGVERSKINILVKQDKGVEVTSETMSSRKQSLESAPEGTVSTFASVFTPLAALTAGVLLAGTGPVAAAIGGGAVAASGAALLMSGYSIPENETDEVLSRLESGHVLVHVQANDDEKVMEIFNRY